MACRQKSRGIAEQYEKQIKDLLQAEFAHGTQAKEHEQCRTACGA
ncbi:MAG TPA: hypothetical protein PL076_11610 [Bacillota bacterium]|nr:hypothetical protein [Bacillota bacterium]